MQRQSKYQTVANLPTLHTEMKSSEKNGLAPKKNQQIKYALFILYTYLNHII